MKHFEFYNAVCVFEFCWNKMTNHDMSEHMKNMKKKFSRFPLAIQNKWKKEFLEKELATSSLVLFINL